MTEIEKCVCGLTPDFLDPHIECPACGRTGIDVELWNHDQRGLRLLREVADAWSQCFYPSPYLVNKVFAWAEEGDRG